LLKKRDNKSFLSVEEYNRQVEHVKYYKTLFNTLGLKKIPKDYKNVYKYNIITISWKDNLIKSEPILHKAFNSRAEMDLIDMHRHHNILMIFVTL